MCYIYNIFTTLYNYYFIYHGFQTQTVYWIVKQKMFKDFKVELWLNRDDVIINLIIILNINKYIKFAKIEKITKIVSK